MGETSDQGTVRCRGDLQLGLRQSVHNSARLTATPDEIRIDSPFENLVLSCEEVESIEQVTWRLFRWTGKSRAFKIVHNRAEGPDSIVFRITLRGSAYMASLLESLRSQGYHVVN
jgi:hypothetical protein